MINYKERCPFTCCGNCTFRITEEHYGDYCTYGLDNPPRIKWVKSGPEFSDCVQAFHEWADERRVSHNGICDVWESGGINKGQ